MSAIESIAWGHMLSTWALVGLIWTIQLVHYPLFARVGDAAFPIYAHAHGLRITPLVAPLMVIEALSGLACWWLLPELSALTTPGVVLLVVIWSSTALLQVPCHRQLADGYDAAVVKRLVRSNWVRTLAWSVRGVIAVGVLRGVVLGG